MAIWPHIGPSDLDGALADVGTAWRSYLEAQSDDELDRAVMYVNSRGDEYHNTVSDIVMHVVVHSEHHRGQVAHMVRNVGGQPPLTDYIQYVRTVGG